MKRPAASNNGYKEKKKKSKRRGTHISINSQMHKIPSMLSNLFKLKNLYITE